MSPVDQYSLLARHCQTAAKEVSTYLIHCRHRAQHGDILPGQGEQLRQSCTHDGHGMNLASQQSRHCIHICYSECLFNKQTILFQSVNNAFAFRMGPWSSPAASPRPAPRVSPQHPRHERQDVPEPSHVTSRRLEVLIATLIMFILPLANVEQKKNHKLSTT